MVISGGPGTGKTTILKAILSIYGAISSRILLAAPTGRAAKRMSEATGRFLQALNTVARARGMSSLAQGTDIPRESLYRSLSAKGNPCFHTLWKTTSILGCTLAILRGVSLLVGQKRGPHTCDMTDTGSPHLRRGLFYTCCW